MKQGLAIVLALLPIMLNAQEWKLKLMHCETGNLIEIGQHSLLSFYNSMESDTCRFVVSRKDLTEISTQLRSFLANTEDEIWINDCVDDGTHLRLLIDTGDYAKKIYIGNYFDQRLAVILSIINSYLDKVRSKVISSVIFTIPYWRPNLDKRTVKRIVKDQSKCKLYPDYINGRFRHDWCKVE